MSMSMFSPVSRISVSTCPQLLAEIIRAVRPSYNACVQYTAGDGYVAELCASAIHSAAINSPHSEDSVLLPLSPTLVGHQAYVSL